MVPTIPTVKIPEDIPFVLGLPAGLPVLTGVGYASTQRRSRRRHGLTVSAPEHRPQAIQGARLAGADTIIAVDAVPREA